MLPIDLPLIHSTPADWVQHPLINFDDFLLAKQGEIYQFSNEFFDSFFLAELYLFASTSSE